MHYFNLKIALLILASFAFIANGQGVMGEKGDLLLARALTIQANLIANDPSKENGYLDLALLLALESTKLQQDSPESYRTALVPTLYSKNTGVTTFRKDNSFISIPEKNILVSASPDGSLSFWDVVTGKIITVTNKTHEGGFDIFQYLPEIDVLVTGGKDKTIAFWQGSTGSKIAGPYSTPKVEALSLASSLDFSQLDFSNLTINDLSNPNNALLEKLSLDSDVFKYFPETDILITGGENETITFWWATTGKPINTIHKAYESGVTQFKYLPEFDMLFTVGGNGIVISWQASTGKTIIKSQEAFEEGPIEFEYHPETDVLIVADKNNAVSFWQGSTGKIIAEPQGSSKTNTWGIEVHGFGYIDKIDVLVTTNLMSNILLWQAKTGKIISEVQEAHNGSVVGFKYLDKSDVLVTFGSSSAREGTIAFWRGSTWELLTEPQKIPITMIQRCKYLAEIDVLITFDNDGSMIFWKGSTGEPLTELQELYQEYYFLEYFAEIDVLLANRKDKESEIILLRGSTGEIISEPQEILSHKKLIMLVLLVMMMLNFYLGDFP